MSDLQIALAAFGAVLVAGVAIYNAVQERRARARAEKAFGERPGDALFNAEGERREPTFGTLPPSDIVEAVEDAGNEARPAAATAAPPAEALEASGGPAAQVSNRIDTVAVILADDPVTSEQLQPLLDALEAHTNPTHVEGIVDEQWHPVETSIARSWRELRVGLQLASRRGPIAEDEIERFNQTIADFSAAVGAVSQREAPTAAAVRAKAIDEFCADADIEVAVNVIGQMGVTFAVARVKSLALEMGLSETSQGELVWYAPDGISGFTVRRFGDAGAKQPASYYTGLTFALDVPHVADAPGVLSEMVGLANTFATTLGGQIVDDNRKPLTDAGLASIRRSLERVFHDMEAHGVPAGSDLARRLFT